MLFGADRLRCRLETASVRSLRQTSKVWVPWVDGPSADHRGADGTQWSILYNIIEKILTLFTFPITKKLIEYHQNT